MEIFRLAETIRLRSHHEKYLTADDDEETVRQDRRSGTTKNTRWTVETVPGSNLIRLQSCYGKYLTATDFNFLLGATGHKVLQTSPEKLDSTTEWEPISDDGVQVRFKTRYGQYLRANKGLPPWRNSVTHDIPSRTATQDWIIWDVDVLQIRVTKDNDSESCSTFSRIESDISSTVSLPAKFEGRLINYEIQGEDGDIIEERSLIFHGSEVEELKKKVEEETGIEDVKIFSRNPLNDQLCPLQLHLPPNNATMHIIVASSSSLCT